MLRIRLQKLVEELHFFLEKLLRDFMTPAELVEKGFEVLELLRLLRGVFDVFEENRLVPNRLLVAVDRAEKLVQVHDVQFVVLHQFRAEVNLVLVLVVVQLDELIVHFLLAVLQLREVKVRLEVRVFLRNDLLERNSGEVFFGRANHFLLGLLENRVFSEGLRCLVRLQLPERDFVYSVMGLRLLLAVRFNRLILAETLLEKDSNQLE